MTENQEPGRAFKREYDLDRTTAFSDGVFAIAITLLVLSLEIPAGANLGKELDHLAPHLLTYALSFAVIARFWVLHHGLFGDLKRVDGRMTLLNLVFLASVSFLPFPTGVLGEYGDQALAVTLYAATVASVATLLLVMRLHALRAGLFDPARSDPQNLDPRAIFTYLGVPFAFLVSIPVAYLWGPREGTITWLVVPIAIGSVLRRLNRRQAHRR